MKYRVKTTALADVNKGDAIEKDNFAHWVHDGYVIFTDDTVIERNPDWFERVEEPEFKEGDWVLYETQEGDGSGNNEDVGNKTQLIRINSLEPTMGSGLLSGDFDAKTDLGWRKLTFNGIKRHATKEEIEQHLIKEAKRRGLHRKDFVSLSDSGGAVYDTNNWFYNPISDRLFTAPKENGGKCVYSRGEWAEIIDEKPQIEINGYKAEFHDGYVKFGCQEVSRETIIELSEILEHIDVFEKGDPTDIPTTRAKINHKIKEIANYYDS